MYVRGLIVFFHTRWFLAIFDLVQIPFFSHSSIFITWGVVMASMTAQPSLVSCTSRKPLGILLNCYMISDMLEFLNCNISKFSMIWNFRNSIKWEIPINQNFWYVGNSNTLEFQYVKNSNISNFWNDGILIVPTCNKFWCIKNSDRLEIPVHQKFWDSGNPIALEFLTNWNSDQWKSWCIGNFDVSGIC